MSGIDKEYLIHDPIEQALASLSPTVPCVDRDALMYQAGYEAAVVNYKSDNQPARIWQAATGLMTAATVALAVVLAQSVSDKPSVVAVEPPIAGDHEPSVAVQAAEATEESDSKKTKDYLVNQQRSIGPPLYAGDPATNYIALRQAIIMRGVDAWPRDNHQEGSAAGDVSTASPRPAANVRNLLHEMLSSEPPPSSAAPNPSKASNHSSKSIA